MLIYVKSLQFLSQLFTWYADVATPQTKSLGKVSYKRGSSYSNCPIAEDKRDSKMDPRNSILSSF